MRGSFKPVMARPEKPVTGDEPIARFARSLRAERERAGITYRAMSIRCHYGVTSLSQAASGSKLPIWPLAQAYLTACGVPKADLPRWHRQWEEADRCR
ncbi:helix-turn-helix protein [Actinocorallia herbida]|uniref:Helix-turn-helix protein n=1 Tax=Actinocorallia herbida TaxID=58109 RepID=A0A3N1D6Y7_9ACTN|nr:helix-turn-helix transcriptional regulator [Actinocorallia herbida]ROO89292.1 helix-turn-helix protein [Actinocorallia herbida]